MNILTLSTYPIDEPQHGGQHRLANIVRLLREAGHTVCAAGVLGSESYPTSDHFIMYPGAAAFTRFIENSFLMEDWAIGMLLANDDSYYKQLVGLISMKPDVIHVEQPWLFAFAERYRKECSHPYTKIIYGSQNIECNLKYGILKKYSSKTVADKGKRKVLACELNALHKADGVCSVSEEDLAWCSDKTKVPLVLTQNGVRDVTVTLPGIELANRITGQSKSALYCASIHPPNIEGFFEMFGAGLGALSPAERLVVAGSAGSGILNDSRFINAAGLAKNLISAGVVSDECLQGLLHVAHAIVLPICHGGGTNLKTAEALWVGKHIVATSTAMRGFEAFIRAEGVVVEDTSAGFCRAVRQVMALPPLKLSQNERDRRKILLWEQTLEPLVRLVSKI